MRSTIRDHAALKELVEQQRQAIAKESQLEGRLCSGVYLKTNPGNGMMLVKDILVVSITTSKTHTVTRTKLLDHSWINPNLLIDGDIIPKVGEKIRFIGAPTEYTRQDGSTSIGFTKLHSLAHIMLWTAFHCSIKDHAIKTNISLEDKLSNIVVILDKLEEHLRVNPVLCSIYLNPKIVSDLLNEYETLMHKWSQRKFRTARKLSRKLVKHENFKGFGRPPEFTEEEAKEFLTVNDLIEQTKKALISQS